MRKPIKSNLLAACMAVLFLTVSCTDNDSNQNKSILDVGLYPNALAQDDTHVYVVDSGNNTIDRLDKKTHQYTNAFVDLGQDAGPYAIHLDGENIYIVNNMAANVVRTTKSAPTKHEIIASKDDGLIAPTSVTTGGGNIVIADSEFNYKNAEDTGGKLLVIASNGDKNSFKTPHQNPSQIIYVDRGNGSKDNRFVAVASGVTQFNKDGSVTAPSTSCLELIQVSEITKESPKIESLCVSNNSLSNIAVTKNDIYAGSGTTPDISRLKHDSNVFESSIHFETKNNAALLTPTVLDERFIAVANFNNDEIFLVDTKLIGGDEMAKQAVLLTDKPATRKGPIGMVYDAKTHTLYVLNSISNSIDIIDVDVPKSQD